MTSPSPIPPISIYTCTSQHHHIDAAQSLHLGALAEAPADMYKQATQKTGEVLSMPSQWLGMYSDFITKNSSAVTQIESALRSLTYIIPGTAVSRVHVDTSLITNRPLPGI
jgi:hypothetical protein